jgi:lipopolysaccharide transport system ATP-binding protein
VWQCCGAPAGLGETVKPSVALHNVSKIYPRQGDNSEDWLGEGGTTNSRVANSPGTKVALISVSLRVQPGERLGIVGPNGAGKSTLLHIIAGLAGPSSGDVTVDGDVTAIFTIGLGLREDLTGRENIYVDGEVRGMRRRQIDGLIDEIVGFADIGESIEYPLRTYSTGMKARLAFAMLIHIVPEILVIDEALSAGDAFFSAKARRKMKEICDRGKIVMIVSHSMQSVIDLCTRCIWMEKGQIVMDGEPAVVTAAYQDSVRKRDEAGLTETVRCSAASVSSRPGCQIVEFEVGTGEGPARASTLFAGEDVEWVVGLKLDVPLQSPEMRLYIVRLDGLVIVDIVRNPIQQDRPHGFSGSMRYRIAMRPLVLGAGLYRSTLELLDHGQVVATKSIVFEVVARQVPKGGNPVLLYPCTISAQLCSEAGCL